MKSQTLVYRTLVFSLYPEKLAADAFQIFPDGMLVLRTGDLAKRLRISVERMKDQLRLLETEGFVENLSISKYYATYRVLRPEILSVVGKQSHG